MYVLPEVLGVSEDTSVTVAKSVILVAAFESVASHGIILRSTLGWVVWSGRMCGSFCAASAV